MKHRILSFMAVAFFAGVMFTACTKDSNGVETSTQSENSGGTQTLIPLETTDFYYGTWRELFYYDNLSES